MKHELTSDESTDLFDKAKPYLRQIDYTHLSKEERLRIIKSARFLDVRVRGDGREYYFEANFIKDLLEIVDNIQTRKVLNEKNIDNEQ
jgi:hypothetical protein